MKKKLAIITLCLLVATAGTASYARTNFDSVVPEDMTKEELVDEYNELRDTYNALYKLYLYEVSGISSVAPSTETETETQAPDPDESLVAVRLTNKISNRGDIGQYYANFTFEVSNGYDKPIKGIQGTATFNDLFGEKILSMKADFTGMKFKPGVATSFTGLYFECNQFDSHDMKLYNTSYGDLKFEYKVSMIVFSDGTTLEF